MAANSAHADASQEPAAQVEAQVASQDAEEQPKSNRRRSAKRRARPTSSDKDVVATSAPTAPSNATATPTLDDPTNPFRALGKSPTDFVNRAVSVQIHRADALRFDVKYISRPVVRVHVLGMS